MTDHTDWISHLLSRIQPLTESEAILLASECEVLLRRAKLCAEAAAANSRSHHGDMMKSVPDSIQAALDDMPSIENWEEQADISRLTGE